MNLHDALLITALALAIMSATRLVAWSWLAVAASFAAIAVVFL